MLAAVVVCWALIARGEPIRLLSPSTVVTDGGSTLRLDPGVFLPQADYEKLDIELRRLQDQETRLEAENDSLKSSLSGWPFIVGGFVAGAVTMWWLK